MIARAVSDECNEDHDFVIGSFDVHEFPISLTHSPDCAFWLVSRAYHYEKQPGHRHNSKMPAIQQFQRWALEGMKRCTAALRVLFFLGYEAMHGGAAAGLKTRIYCAAGSWSPM